MKKKRAERKAEKQREKEEAQKKSLKMGLLLMGIALLICVGMYVLGGNEEEAVSEEPAVEETSTNTSEETAADKSETQEKPVIGSDISTVGDKVTFGEYDGKGMTWWVCEVQDGKSLIVSTDKVADMPFNDTVQAEAIDWKLSTLRTFLNDTFLNDAFNDTDRQCILETEYECDDSSVQDLVFILNEDQYRKYSNLDNVRFNNNCWLIDSVISTLNRLEESDIDRSGELDYGLRNNEDCGVRPAMWVDTELFKETSEASE